MNSSKSAYAKVSFASNRFFSKYHFEGAAQSRNKFFCKLYNRVKMILLLLHTRTGS